MKRFQQVVDSVYRGILLEQDQPPGLPQTGGPTAPPPAAPVQPAPAPAPAPETPPAEEPKPVSSEGLRNLVDLIQRALVISPDSLDAADKAVFDDKVTIDNALDKQKQLTDIVDRLNPASSE